MAKCADNTTLFIVSDHKRKLWTSFTPLMLQRVCFTLLKEIFDGVPIGKKGTDKIYSQIIYKIETIKAKNLRKILIIKHQKSLWLLDFSRVFQMTQLHQQLNASSFNGLIEINNKPSIKTTTISLIILNVVQITKTEKMKVQTGSASFHSGCEYTQHIQLTIRQYAYVQLYIKYVYIHIHTHRYTNTWRHR